ncbi:MAG: GntR family transcriptional regulator [Christensenellales bacterium]
MQIDFASEVPIYVQIADQLSDAILTGAFPEGTQVPSTTEISVSYKVNPATVLKGMGLLTDRGILYKKRGVGMFVSEGAVERLRQARRQDFYQDYVVRLLQEAEKLGIGQQDLIEMIRGGVRHG